MSKASQVSRQTLPPFLVTLWEMVHDQEDQAIEWCPEDDGSSFHIPDFNAFESVTLPHHFKHTKFTSFVRQLNMYGFQKLGENSKRLRWRHPYFREGRPELLSQIKRKATQNVEQAVSARSKRQLDELTHQIAQLTTEQEEQKERIQELEQDKEGLLEDLTAARLAEAKAQQTLESMLVFFGSLFDRLGLDANSLARLSPPLSLAEASALTDTPNAASNSVLALLRAASSKQLRLTQDETSAAASSTSLQSIVGRRVTRSSAAAASAAATPLSSSEVGADSSSKMEDVQPHRPNAVEEIDETFTIQQAQPDLLDGDLLFNPDFGARMLDVDSLSDSLPTFGSEPSVEEAEFRVSNLHIQPDEIMARPTRRTQKAARPRAVALPSPSPFSVAMSPVSSPPHQRRKLSHDFSNFAGASPATIKIEDDLKESWLQFSESDTPRSNMFMDTSDTLSTGSDTAPFGQGAGLIAAAFNQFVAPHLLEGAMQSKGLRPPVESSAY